MDVTIAIPVRNEADDVAKAVLAARKYMRKSGKSYEIIIAEGGSTDGTMEEAENVCRCMPEARLVSVGQRGKGRAIKEAFMKSRGSTFIFMDADLSTDMCCMGRLMDGIENGYDVVIGSRRQKGSEVERRQARRAMTIAYNSIAEALFHDHVKDRQCGFKAFRASTAGSAIRASANNGWLWDTEVIARSRLMGLKILEVPVKWKEDRQSRLSLHRDSARMLVDLLRLRWMLAWPRSSR